MEKILVTRSSMPELEEYVEEIKSLFESHWLTNMGEKHNELEERLAKYLDVNNILLFSNGHMALELLIQALDLTGEVITTPFTFASTTHAIVRNGLTPVFCDVNPSDYTIDVNKIEALITERTSAILPVHVYGHICDVEAIERIAEKHHLKVIYDAAHTFGVRYKGKGIASYGNASMFSFHATKVFNSIEGGAVCFHSEENGLREKLYGLKNFGIWDEELIKDVGANAKMNEFQAAMGLCNLRHIERELAKRKLAVERYNERLEGQIGIKVSKDQKDVTPNYAYYPVLIEPKEFGKTRDEVYELLKANEIYARKYFYPLTNTFACYKGKFDAGNTPVAMDLSGKVLTLPLYADLRRDQIDRICDIVLGK